MDRVAGGGAHRRMTVVEESRNVLRLVVAGHHELDAVSHQKPSRIWNQRDSVLDRHSDRHCLRVAAREDWRAGAAFSGIDLAQISLLGASGMTPYLITATLGEGRRHEQA